MIAPTREPMTHFFITVGFGLDRKGKNKFHFLQGFFWPVVNGQW
jgi:hypothetical protein